MQKSFVVVVALILTVNLASFAQNDYIDYNLKIFQARKLKYENKQDSAVLIFQQAFKSVGYIHIENINNALELAKKQNNDSLKKFCYKQKDKYDQILKLNEKLIFEIDKINNEDQRIRSKKYLNARDTYYKFLADTTLNKSSIEFTKSEKLMKEWWSIDSSNINRLLHFISIHGFPGERLVGTKTYKNAFYILLHFDNDTGCAILKPIIDKALLNGDMDPNDYGWIIDRRLSWMQNKSQYYYTMPMGTKNLTKTEIAEINIRRNKIGLRDLFEGIEITEGKGFVKVKKLY